MSIDRDGIPRATRWGEREHSAGDIDWAGVVADLAALGAEPAHLRAELGRMAEHVACSSDTMKELGVDRTLVERLHRPQQTLALALGRAQTP